MTDAWLRFQKIVHDGEFIIPVPHHKLTVVESNIELDPEKCWIICVSEYALSDEVVKRFCAEHSGLEDWRVVAGYPYLNSDRLIEWRLRRNEE